LEPATPNFFNIFGSFSHRSLDTTLISGAAYPL
jgi:hypothetical protein